MKLYHVLFFLSLTGLLLSFGEGTGSNTNSNDEKLLKEAAQIHQEAIDIGMAIAPRLASLRQMKNGMNVQGRTLTPEEITLTTAIANIEDRHNYWQTHLIEVPGHEHDHHHHGDGHDHNHDHSHDHSPSPNMTAEQMLAVQKEIRDSIMVIRDGIKEVEGLVK
ncbi:MAG: hypothetical protein AAGG75_02535 [Bacteroidota bacterium]